MNFLTLLDQIDTEQLDGEAKDKFLSRKQALGKMSNFSKKMALSALPLGAISAFGTPVKAQSTEDLINVLNFALTLEYLEAEYYQTGLDSGVITGDGQTVFQQINKHEQAHVIVLQDVITNTLGGQPVESLTFDFTAGGSFAPFEDYATFLALSQAFEDTGVRAYKGQAGAVQGNDEVLTRALQIHSVEARHAAEVRRLRELNGWITGVAEDEGVPSAAEAVYAGEDNTTQIVPVADTLSGDGDVDTGDITEAWDEPMAMEDVNALVSLFIQS